jgi:MFS family permease
VATAPSLPPPVRAPRQVPSNLVMVRVGFRPWLAFLLVAWGAVASCFMFTHSVWSFYLLRLLLGVFEAGAFPAMWYALAVFFPRGRCGPAQPAGPEGPWVCVCVGGG